jgi:hypothetical protein
MKSSTAGADDKKLDIDAFLRIFNRFSKRERLKIAEKIAMQEFEARWLKLDKELPDTRSISDSTVLKEVAAVRYGKKRES